MSNLMELIDQIGTLLWAYNYSLYSYKVDTLNGRLEINYNNGSFESDISESYVTKLRNHIIKKINKEIEDVKTLFNRSYASIENHYYGIHDKDSIGLSNQNSAILRTLDHNIKRINRLKIKEQE